MPIYEYACKNCGHEFEELVRGDETPSCPSCGQGRLEKRMSAPAAHSSGPSESACPARETCGMPRCCGQNCGMGEWT